MLSPATRARNVQDTGSRPEIQKAVSLFIAGWSWAGRRAALLANLLPPFLRPACYWVGGRLDPNAKSIERAQVRLCANGDASCCAGALYTLSNIGESGGVGC